MKYLVLGLAIAGTGCVFEQPDVGELIAEEVACDNSDSNPAVAVSFALEVHPLITRSPGGCSPCHLGRATSGLDLSSYESLRRGGLNSGSLLIVPKEPCNSILPKKLEMDAAYLRSRSTAVDLAIISRTIGLAFGRGSTS